MPLLQVIYASAAVRKLPPEELAEILAVARERNSAEEISGLLVYHDGSFLQVLEGPEERVDALVAKIKKDPRHHKFKLLLRDRIAGKEFEEWNMGFADTSGATRDMEGFLDYERELNDALADKAMAQRVLKKFRSGLWQRYLDPN